MTTACFGCSLLIVLFGGDGGSGKTLPPPGGKPVFGNGLRVVPGDRFVVHFGFSNRWSVEHLSRSPGRGRTGVAKQPRSPASPVAPRGATGRGGSPDAGTGGAVSRGGRSSGVSGGKSGSTTSPAGAGRAAGRPSGETGRTGDAARRPVTRAELRRGPPNRGLPSSTAGRDPLLVNMRFHAEVVDSRRLSLKTDVTRVHYTDSQGTNWTLKPRQPDARSVAVSMAEELVEKLWTSVEVNMEADMIKEQLLGLGIVCLNDATLEVDLDSVASERPRLIGFSEFLERRLPSCYTRSLRYDVESFFRDAVARMIAPRSEHWRNPDLGISKRGVLYRLERMYRRGGRLAAQVFGKTYNARTGIGFKDMATVDLGTGLVLRRSFLRYQDPIRSQKVLFASRRWQLRLTNFRPSPARRGESR